MRREPEAFVRALFPALRQAASIARALEGRVQNRPKSGAPSDVKAALTVADTAAQEALLVPLFEHFPEVALEAEEDTPTARRFPRVAPRLVVVDPIDGTLRSYLDGLGPYGVLVGLALDGRYEAALVALPREGLFFTGVRGRGARAGRAGGRLRPARLDRGGRRVMVSYETPAGVRERLAARGFEVVQGCGGAIAVAPLIPGLAGGLRLAAPGASISRQGRIGVLLAREAGARIAGEDGGPFPDALDAPARALLVARDDAVLADLRFALGGA
jgi:fructose-1,6-bisphosphatase/inositol monophosphatase family enzyme